MQIWEWNRGKKPASYSQPRFGVKPPELVPQPILFQQGFNRERGVLE
jgi:hypothetical protein